MELDPGVEEEGPEEGDGVDLALPHYEVSLSRDLADRVGQEEAGQALLDRSGFEGVGERTLPMVSQFGLGLAARHPSRVGAEGRIPSVPWERGDLQG